MNQHVLPPIDTMTTVSRRAMIAAKIACRVVEEPAPDWMTPHLGPCKIWTGPDSGRGRGGDYPRMHLDGQTVAVHIVSWTNEHGFVPGKKQLDHLCRRRRCVSDLHLELVTHKQNQKRRDRAMREGK
jgi:hypothetical protein